MRQSEKIYLFGVSFITLDIVAFMIRGWSFRGMNLGNYERRVHKSRSKPVAW